MKLRTRQTVATETLFFEATPKYVGGFMTATDIYSHEVRNVPHEYYLIFRYPPYRYSGSVSNYCRISIDNISATKFS